MSYPSRIGLSGTWHSECKDILKAKPRSYKSTSPTEIHFWLLLTARGALVVLLCGPRFLPGSLKDQSDTTIARRAGRSPDARGPPCPFRQLPGRRDGHNCRTVCACSIVRPCAGVGKKNGNGRLLSHSAPTCLFHQFGHPRPVPSVEQHPFGKSLHCRYGVGNIDGNSASA